MEVWQKITENAERGAERHVAEYGDRLYDAATPSKLHLINALMSRNLWPAARTRFSLPESEIAAILAESAAG